MTDSAYWTDPHTPAHGAPDPPPDLLQPLTADEWRAGYKGFLDSPRWKQLRERVLDRDRGLCQCCLLYPATQVHHRSYPEGQWDVPCWELAAICDDCHKRFSGTRWDGQ